MRTIREPMDLDDDPRPMPAHFRDGGGWDGTASRFSEYDLHLEHQHELARTALLVGIVVGLVVGGVAVYGVAWWWGA